MRAGSLIRHAWTYSRGDGEIIVPRLYLLPDGTIGGCLNIFEQRWSVQRNRLNFYDVDGLVSTSFRVTEGRIGRPRKLMGFSRPFPPTQHILTAVEHERPPLARIKPVLRRKPTRRNLVIVPANAGSKHLRWLRDIGEHERNWDLCVSWYGQDQPSGLGAHEYVLCQPGTMKFDAVYKIMSAGTGGWGYDYFWLVDDDILTSWKTINRLFEICRRFRLDLAQPSLSASSYVTHPITAQEPGLFLRFSQFVEVMCPVFSQAALRSCLSTFPLSPRGFGLDHVWPKLLGGTDAKIAIIDAVSVEHTRPFAQQHDVSHAIAMDEKIRTMFKVVPCLQITGQITQPN